MPTVRHTVGPRNPVSTPDSMPAAKLDVRAIEPPPGGTATGRRRACYSAASHRGNYVAVTLSPRREHCQWWREKDGKDSRLGCSEGVRAEVFGAHRLDELAELLDLGLLVLIVDDDARVGQHVRRGEDRDAGANGEGDGVARPARNGILRAVARHLQRGVERRFAQFCDDDALD